MIKRRLKFKMFGKKTTQTEKTAVAQVKKELADANKKIDSLTPDLVVENAGMPGFVEDVAPAPAEASAPAKDEGIPGFGSIGAPAPEATEPVVPQIPAPAATPIAQEQYQIVETAIGPAEGLYVYKIVTNKYLGELGGVYQA